MRAILTAAFVAAFFMAEGWGGLTASADETNTTHRSGDTTWYKHYCASPDSWSDALTSNWPDAYLQDQWRQGKCKMHPTAVEATLEEWLSGPYPTPNNKMCSIWLLGEGIYVCVYDHTGVHPTAESLTLINHRARPLCMARDTLVETLFDKYQERPIGRGINVDGDMLEIFASEDGATWSVVLTAPGAESCMTDAGDSWSEVRATQPMGDGT